MKQEYARVSVEMPENDTKNILNVDNQQLAFKTVEKCF